MYDIVPTGCVTPVTLMLAVNVTCWFTATVLGDPFRFTVSGLGPTVCTSPIAGEALPEKLPSVGVNVATTSLVPAAVNA